MVASVALVVVTTGLWFGFHRANLIRYHLSRMRSLERSWAPSTVRDYFRFQTWQWYLHGRPTTAQSSRQIAEHRQALVRLGYYETRAFVLKRRTLDRSAHAEFNALLATAPFSDRHWVWGTVGDWPAAVTVTARPEDMMVWANIISRFDLNAAR